MNAPRLVVTNRLVGVQQKHQPNPNMIGLIGTTVDHVNQVRVKFTSMKPTTDVSASFINRTYGHSVKNICLE